MRQHRRICQRHHALMARAARHAVEAARIRVQHAHAKLFGARHQVLGACVTPLRIEMQLVHARRTTLQAPQHGMKAKNITG